MKVANLIRINTMLLGYKNIRYVMYKAFTIEEEYGKLGINNYYYRQQ